MTCDTIYYTHFLLSFILFIFTRASHTRDLHSFPTRRSSDLSSMTLPEILLDNMNYWKSNKTKRPPTFSVHKSGPQLQASFTYLTPQEDSSVLVFLEDSSHLIQRVKQLKLASLGRLTASIAHEKIGRASCRERV